MKKLARFILLPLMLLAGVSASAQNINSAIQGPWTLPCSVPLTVTASSAYASGNVVGGGPLSCLNAARVAGHGGVIQSVMLTDKAGQNVAYDLFLFGSAPSTQTDKSAVALTAADLAKMVTSPISLSGIVLGAASTNGAMGADGIGKAFVLGGTGTTLYLVLVTRGTPTYASTSDLTLTLTFLPD